MQSPLNGTRRKTKAAADKPAGKKPAGKKGAAKKTPAKKTPAKEGAAKKTPAKKTPAKEGAAKKPAGKKPAAGKAGSRPGVKPGKKTVEKAAAARRRTAALDAALSRHQLPPVWRAVILLVAFVAMVGFAVVLSKLTLGPSAASESLVHSNLRPGASIRSYLAQPALRDTLKQLGGNIVLGMPLGALLPALVPRTRGLLRVMAATALTMLLVELVQGALVQGRAFDIDDVILNTTGAMLGYLVLGRRLGRAVHPRRRHWWHRKHRPSKSGTSRGASSQRAKT